MTYQPVKRNLLSLFLLIFFLSACQFPLGIGAETPTSIPELPPTPIPTPTPPPPRTLTICLGADPNTLYPLGGPNAAARSVLEAIYDGPMDVIKYQYQPVILKKIPSIASGDTLIDPVPVKMGDSIIDADGNLAFLETGLRVRPAGCRSDDCRASPGTAPGSGAAGRLGVREHHA